MGEAEGVTEGLGLFIYLPPCLSLFCLPFEKTRNHLNFSK